MVHSGEEAGPVPVLSAHPRTRGKKNAVMEDIVFQELPDVRLDDSDFESALLKEGS